MCRVWDRLHHCYSCQREFAHAPQLAPCLAVERGLACRGAAHMGPLVVDHETCAACADAQRAEETCQRVIRRLAPLYYNPDKKRAVREAYWSSVNTRKQEHREAARKAEEDGKAGRKVEAPKKKGPELVPCPPFTAMRHVPPRFLDDDGK
ncbi:hypothetical protein GGR52DRAFT_435956 [Hypoxylon sp. FL1284]|nr:hypothetical protein GGR52DRAFT_435956 [Hypoxylon sp. FL1284]